MSTKARGRKEEGVTVKEIVEVYLKARGRKEEGVTVKEIVEVYLVVLGYDGLYTEDCGCLIADLMPCDGEGPECRPGYRQHHGQAHPEMPACDGEDCECIGPKKPDGRKP